MVKYFITIGTQERLGIIFSIGQQAIGMQSTQNRTRQKPGDYEMKSLSCFGVSLSHYGQCLFVLLLTK